MSHLRSENMYLHKMCVSKDNAWKSIRQLGDTKLAHFLDINKDQQPFALPYSSLIKRNEHLLRRIEMISTEYSYTRIP